MIALTFPTTVARCTLSTTHRFAVCSLTGDPFYFDITATYRPRGRALTMECFHAIVTEAAHGRTTAEGIAETVRARLVTAMPRARRVRVVVSHAADKHGVELAVRAG